MARLNKSKPFSKENCIWVTADEAAILKGDCIRLTYDNKFLTFKEWSAEVGVSAAAIKNRYYKHPDWDIKDIIYGKRPIRWNKKPKDWKDSAASIRQKASKMISAYKHKDMYLGVTTCDIDIDWMIDNIIKKPCVYCGDTNRIGCDRIDNNKGHTKDNVVPCCYECNCARNNNFSYDEMLIIGKAIKNVKQLRQIS